MTREELERAAQEMSWEDQNWLFNRLMERSLAGSEGEEGGLS